MSATLVAAAIKAARYRLQQEADEALTKRLTWEASVEPLRVAINDIQLAADRKEDQPARFDYAHSRITYGPKFGEMSEPRAAYVKFVDGVVRVSDVPYYRLPGNPDEQNQRDTYTVAEWLERLAYELLKGGAP